MAIGLYQMHFMHILRYYFYPFIYIIIHYID